jgi:hypothetical protein
MNMTTATMTTDIRYEYMHIIDMMNIFLNFFATTTSFTILSSVIVYISNIVFLCKEKIYMNRLQVISAIEKRKKILAADADSDTSLNIR